MRFLALLCVTLPGFGQVTEEFLPLPLSDRRVLEPGRTAPLTPGEKATRAVRNTVGLHAIANRLAITGIKHWQGDPWEWGGGMEGYGLRLGDRMGILAVRNGVMLATDLAFGLDPRYHRCECTGFLPRTGHAWKRVVVARTDNGGNFVNVSRLAGAYVTPIVAEQWRPDRFHTTGYKLGAGSTELAWTGAMNMVREFWPEIRRLIPLKRLQQ